MKKIIAIVLIGVLTLTGCTTLQQTATSTKTFAMCKTADVATTALALRSGGFVESNSFVAGLLGHGYIPLIGISVGIYYLLDYLNSPTVTAVANIATCGAALNNAALLL